MPKYTREVLAPLVLQNTSLAGVLRALGIYSYSGSMSSLIRSKIELYGLDTSHFLGSGWNRGGVSSVRKTAAEILKQTARRVPRAQLYRALIELGRPYQCEICSQGSTWNELALVLPIDHIDGNWKNNDPANLRFLCPNCHSQTETYGHKARPTMGRMVKAPV